MQYKPKKLVNKCCICGKSFYVFKCEKHIRKYCSSKCYHNTQKGKPLSEYHKNKISKSLINKPKTPQAKVNISIGRKKYLKKNPMPKGKDACNFKTGRIGTGQGYIKILIPSHPGCCKYGYVQEHRLVMEKHIGRFLTKKERIHHINKIRHDNRIENLKLCPTESFHQNTFHSKRTI